MDFRVSGWSSSHSQTLLLPAPFVLRRGVPNLRQVPQENLLQRITRAESAGFSLTFSVPHVICVVYQNDRARSPANHTFFILKVSLETAWATEPAPSISLRACLERSRMGCQSCPLAETVQAFGRSGYTLATASLTRWWSRRFMAAAWPRSTAAKASTPSEASSRT